MEVDKQHCECRDKDCRKMHKCRGTGCGCNGAYLTPDKFKEWRGKRCLTCVKQSEWNKIQNQKEAAKRARAVYRKSTKGKKSKALSNARTNPRNNARWNAIAKERRQQEWEEAERKVRPNVDFSKEKDEAVEAAMARFNGALAKVRHDYGEDRIITCNVFGASAGTTGNSVEEEGLRSSLMSGFPTVVVADPEEEGGWRLLCAKERRDLGPPGIMIADLGDSRPLSMHVEEQVQLKVQEMAKADPLLRFLWKQAGKGGPQGTWPYHVGARFFVHDASGFLPGGVCQRCLGPSECCQKDHPPLEEKPFRR